MFSSTALYKKSPLFMKIYKALKLYVGDMLPWKAHVTRIKEDIQSFL